MTTPSRLFLALILAAAAGCAPSSGPFESMTDCPKIAYCGQCASRGGCAWCGPADESGQGQCVAVGHSECTAPSAFRQTPDRCPLPPADAGLVTASAPIAPTAASASPDDSGPEKIATVKAALHRAFPSANVNDAVANEVVQLLLRMRRLGPPGVAVPTRRERAPIAKHVEEKEHRLYLANATHHRVKALPPASRPLQSEFTMALPVVRVTLPDRLDPGHTTIETELGDVDLSLDHLLGSIDLVQAKYGGAQYLGYRPARVDLLTPARALHTRFGAIAVYLGYRNKADRGPSFYLLEAGTATGDAKMIYYSPDMKPIVGVTSGYLPTPFVTMRNTYSGGITMKPAPDEDEPAQLVVNSYVGGDKDAYITVTVDYQRKRSFDNPVPAELTVDAGARVSRIAQTMGLPHAEDLEPLLADLATSLLWHDVPRYAAPAAPPATIAPTAPPATTAAPATTSTARP